MQDNRKKINKIAGLAAGVWLISLLVFLGYCYQSKAVAVWVIGIYGGWNLVIFASAYAVISRTVTRVMKAVADCIQSLIDGKSVQHFSMQEETILGKFQMQIMKLFQIMTGAKEREQEKRTEMSALVSDLVHQVNTPLTNIQMYCGFLMHDELPKEERQQICEVIDSQVEKLGWFAEGFAKTARLEDDIMQLEPEKQLVVTVVLRAIDQIALKAKLQGCDILLEGNQNIKAVFDRRWTEEAVFNLLDNAVKYGKTGCPVTVALAEYEMFVRIDVKNWGKVIGKEEYNKLFTRFYRGEDAALVKDGVGLGLYLTRQIVMEQGGYVKVGPYGSKGSVFSIFLRK